MTRYAFPQQDGRGHPRPTEAIVFSSLLPKGDPSAPLKALILDSYFDEYRGVVATVRVFDGSIKKGDILRMMQGGEDFLVDGVGVKHPAEALVESIGVGEVGFVVTGLKDPEAVHVGDTLTMRDEPCVAPLPGYREAKPMVYTGIFPIDNKDYENLREALDKLHVNDPSLTWTPETIVVGLRFPRGLWDCSHGGCQGAPRARVHPCLIATSPSVDYHGIRPMAPWSGPQPAGPSDATRIDRIEEPYLKAKIIVPREYTGRSCSSPSSIAVSPPT